MATWGNITLMDSNAPLMEQLNHFHDHAMIILYLITIVVSYIMLMLFFNKLTNRFLLSGQTIEIIWTVLPAFILLLIAFPSLKLLYLMDESNDPILTIKATGHQWFWSYEYSDFKNIEFDSYMIPTNELKNNEFRLIEVDNRLVLPSLTPIRLIVTAMDVLHSWTIPCLGIKIDATPGRLNQGFFEIKRSGLMFGQCSEICGVNHSFMPIVIEAIPCKHFISWIHNFNN